MATTSAPDASTPSPYTPAGDIDSVLTDLDAVALEAATADERPDSTDDVLPDLDDALAELAATVDGPDGDDADDTSTDDAAVEWTLRHERAEFDAVAESTDVESVPFDDAATFLASDLYAVPPANTRFDWVDEDALT